MDRKDATAQVWSVVVGLLPSRTNTLADLVAGKILNRLDASQNRVSHGNGGLLPAQIRRRLTRR